jgi:hypothetical protein
MQAKRSDFIRPKWVGYALEGINTPWNQALHSLDEVDET